VQYKSPKNLMLKLL